MIKITGSIARAFIFPAPIDTTIEYYGNLARVTQFMPHINLVEEYKHNEVRILYKTVELGTYTIRIFCDLTANIAPEENRFEILPKVDVPAVESQAHINSATTQGIFTLKASVFELGEQSRVEYEIQLKAELPRPLGMKLMPKMMVNRIAKNIASSRIREIADGFIKASVDAFPEWNSTNEFA